MAWRRNKMRTEELIELLDLYLQIYNARVYNYEIANNKIVGKLQWKDTKEFQEFSWLQSFKLNEILRIKILINYLIDNKLIKGDRIIKTEKDLKELLIQIGWNEDDINKMIEELLSIEIKMIDEGEETDSFFLHF